MKKSGKQITDPANDHHVEWITKKNWKQVQEETSHTYVIAYMGGTEAMARKLEYILSKNASFDELRKELTDLVKERTQLVTHVHNKI